MHVYAALTCKLTPNIALIVLEARILSQAEDEHSHPDRQDTCANDAAWTHAWIVRRQKEMGGAPEDRKCCKLLLLYAAAWCEEDQHDCPELARSGKHHLHICRGSTLGYAKDAPTWWSSATSPQVLDPSNESSPPMLPACKSWSYSLACPVLVAMCGISERQSLGSAECPQQIYLNQREARQTLQVCIANKTL